MANKERYANPTCNDTLNLRLLVYNANSLTNVQSIEKVEIYFLDPTAQTDANPDGRTLIQTIDDINQDDDGKYSIEVELTSPQYVIGNYLDVWTVNFREGECPGIITNLFKVYPDLWFTTTSPPVYDFSFSFRPNRIPHGTKRYVAIEVTPNVPRGSDLARYYENLAIAGELRVSLELVCGDCVPAEQDLRLVVDRTLVDYRERGVGYYYLDTSEMACGTYNVWFELTIGENVYVSDKDQLQII